MCPVYCYKCRGCGRKEELLLRHQELSQPQTCPECSQPMARDFKTEAATNAFHPTRDLYAQSKGKK